MQAIPKAPSLTAYWKRDARGSSLESIALMQRVKVFSDISSLFQFTGLLGIFDSYIQFFQSAEYRPVFGHGCTSITIPEAFIYLDSGQLLGLLEGIAGAAWYSARLSEANAARAPDTSMAINTGLGVAHLLIIALIAIGNGVFWVRRIRGEVV